jgi:hypothetical protein
MPVHEIGVKKPEAEGHPGVMLRADRMAEHLGLLLYLSAAMKAVAQGPGMTDYVTSLMACSRSLEVTAHDVLRDVLEGDSGTAATALAVAAVACAKARTQKGAEGG